MKDHKLQVVSADEYITVNCCTRLTKGLLKVMGQDLILERERDKTKIDFVNDGDDVRHPQRGFSSMRLL